MNLPPDLAHLQHPAVRRLAGYWLGRRQSRLMPGFRDIDPVEIADALPALWVIDLHPEGGTRIRLVGDTVTRRLGFYPGGKTLAEALPARVAVQLRALATPVAVGGLIAHQAGAVLRTAVRPLSGERLVLPLADDGVHVTNLLGLTVLDGPEPPGPLGFDFTLPTTYTPVSELPRG